MQDDVAQPLPDASNDDVGPVGEGQISKLLSWDHEGATPDDVHARLLSHPLYPQAARALAAKMLVAAEHDRTLDGIFKDAGRYVAAMCAVYLDVTSALTLPGLKALCVESGLLSPGRARALLLYLQYLGYITPMPRREKGEPTRYRLTRTFDAAWRIQLVAALEAARFVEPAVDLVLQRLDEPDIFATFSRHQVEGLLAAAKGPMTETAFLRVFMHRHAGTQLVWTLLAPESEAFPPSAPIPFTVTQAAQRFGVSRMHVRRIIRDAEAEGFLTSQGPGFVTLTELGRSELQYMYSSQLIRLLVPAARALRECQAAPERVVAAGF